MLPQDTPRGGGLYIIRLSDTHFYGGRTTSFRRRWRNHLRDLKKGTHDNIRMQRVFNKYGRFEPEVLQRLKRDEHAEAEQEWLDTHYRKKGCVNLSPHALGGCDGHTEGTRAKMSKTRRSRPDLLQQARKAIAQNRKAIPRENMVARAEAMTQSNIGRTQSPESVAKRAESNRGQKRSDDTRSKMSESAKRRCIEHPLTHGEETKALISTQQKGRIWINDGEKNRRLFPEDAAPLLESGWERGRVSR